MRRTFLALAPLLMVGSMFVGAAPAQADAANGICEAGARLTSYTTTEPAYSTMGTLMWRISYTKRWCYNYTAHSVTSWTARTSVQFYNGMGNVWHYEGISDSDAYYSSRNALGVATRYPRFSHVSWIKAHMRHCAVVWAFCTDEYYHLGIQAFSDGSKKLA